MSSQQLRLSISQSLVTKVLTQLSDASQLFYISCFLGGFLFGWLGLFVCFLNMVFGKMRLIFQLQTVQVDLDRNVFRLMYVVLSLG